MKVFGFELTVARVKQALSRVPSSWWGSGGGWFTVLGSGDTSPGSWQSVMPSASSPQDLLAFSAVFSCTTGIATDISKLAIGLVQKGTNGIYDDVIGSSPYWPVLRKPNRYQTRMKFIEQWIVSKLLYGNTYVLKQRDLRGIVTELYVLDARRVRPLVAEDGGVYYELSQDYLASVDQTITLPASEIIHDTMVCLWHPLVGVSPIYACAVSAIQGRSIQGNSNKFFENMSRPSGGLTAPGTISDEVAARLKREFDANFSGKNIGRTWVGGDGLKYEPMTIPAQEAQLIEQLEWTVEDVARCYHYPVYLLGGPLPTGTTIGALKQSYYDECLQGLIESLEDHLDEGLGLGTPGYETEVDTAGLLRMDTAARYEANASALKAGWKAPNEVRADEDMQPVVGGYSPMMQQQNYSLAALAKRDAKEDPFATAKPALPAPTPTPTSDDTDAAQEAAALAELFIKGLADLGRGADATP